jgi:hypothetical protein
MKKRNPKAKSNSQNGSKDPFIFTPLGTVIVTLMLLTFAILYAIK